MAATNDEGPITKNESFHCPVTSRRNPEETTYVLLVSLQRVFFNLVTRTLGQGSSNEEPNKRCP